MNLTKSYSNKRLKELVSNGTYARIVDMKKTHNYTMRTSSIANIAKENKVDHIIFSTGDFSRTRPRKISRISFYKVSELKRALIASGYEEDIKVITLRMKINRLIYSKNGTTWKSEDIRRILHSKLPTFILALIIRRSQESIRNKIYSLSLRT